MKEILIGIGCLISCCVIVCLLYCLSCYLFGIGCPPSDVGGPCATSFDCNNHGAPGINAICCTDDGSEQPVGSGRTGRCYTMDGLKESDENSQGKEESGSFIGDLIKTVKCTLSGDASECPNGLFIPKNKYSYRSCTNTGISHCPIIKDKDKNFCERNLGESCKVATDCQGWGDGANGGRNVACCNEKCRDTNGSGVCPLPDSVSGVINNDYSSEINDRNITTKIIRKLKIGTGNNNWCWVDYGAGKILRCNRSKGNAHNFDWYKYGPGVGYRAGVRQIRFSPDGKQDHMCEFDGNGVIKCNSSKPTNSGVYDKAVPNPGEPSDGRFWNGLNHFCRVDGGNKTYTETFFNEGKCKWTWAI